MIRNETRESAHLRSRVKDLSVVPNVVSYTGLFAAITPIAKLKKNDEQLYSPVLVRDTDSLIANFGDPRIDPKKYIDLYSIMQVVGNGTSCYIAKVNSGDSGIYKFPFLADQTYQNDVDGAASLPLTRDADNPKLYAIRGLNNKYIVTGLKGYSDSYVSGDFVFVSDSFEASGGEEGDALPSNGEKDFIGKYTWKCIQKGDTFDLEITLIDNIDTTGIETLVAYGSIDPSWGSEKIYLKAEADTENKIVHYDAEKKVASFTLKSTKKLDNEYILLNSAVEDFIEKFRVTDIEGVEEPEITYTYSDNHLVMTVSYKSATDKSADIETALDEELHDSGELKEIEIADNSTTRSSHAMIAYSSMSEDLTFDVYLTQTKPYSLHVYYLNIAVKNGDGTNTLGSVRVKLESTTTNQGLVNNINSALGTIVRFELIDPSTEAACPKKDRGANSIVKALLDRYCMDGEKPKEKLDPNPTTLEQPIVDSKPNFHVSMNDYIAALGQYTAKKYAGCLMADLTAPVSRNMDDDNLPAEEVEDDVDTFMPSHEERRALHYNLKQIACERKDATVILSTPYYPSHDNLTVFTIDDACDWVTSSNAYADLWEYGVTNTVDYSIQSFYLEIYFSWLMQTCTKIESGLAKSVKVLTAPANLVINNVLTSYRERGVNYPVAGDQYGTLPETCAVTVNPKTKAERDQLVQCRINPIYDTGTRGIQIYGNETLNAGYTDLNAAHIARTLVDIRRQVDEYTETLKFLINSQVLWDQWKNYVSMYILEPYKAANALAEYSVKMGEDTTTREEIANRTVNGIIYLRFYQAAEIFDLTFVVYSTATTLEAEGVV